MTKRYIVNPTADERAGLLALLNKGAAPARKLTRARILLLADEGGTATARSPPPSLCTRPRWGGPGGAASRAARRRR